VAIEDDTEIQIRPNVDIVDGRRLLGVGRGRTRSWTLARGEVAQVTQSQDTSGSPFVASKSVGLFGGSTCIDLPTNGCCCDVTHQQIPPVSQWGSAYALVPYRSRISSFGEGNSNVVFRETVPWRFVGASDGTTLTYDPVRPRGAPETLDAGQVVTFMTQELV